MPEQKPKINLAMIKIGKFKTSFNPVAIKLIMLKIISALLIPIFGAIDPPIKDPIAIPNYPAIVNIVMLFKIFDCSPFAAFH